MLVVEDVVPSCPLAAGLGGTGQSAEGAAADSACEAALGLRGADVALVTGLRRIAYASGKTTRIQSWNCSWTVSLNPDDGGGYCASWTCAPRMGLVGSARRNARGVRRACRPCGLLHRERPHNPTMAPNMDRQYIRMIPTQLWTRLIPSSHWTRRLRGTGGDPSREVFIYSVSGRGRAKLCM